MGVVQQISWFVSALKGYVGNSGDADVIADTKEISFDTNGADMATTRTKEIGLGIEDVDFDTNWFLNIFEDGADMATTGTEEIGVGNAFLNHSEGGVDTSEGHN
ncbi:unnamed protein product [Calypogeia fissa]